MKITFTTSEIDEWLEALERCFCTAAEEDIRQYEMITKKLKNAVIRSKASRGKERSIQDAQRKKQLAHDDDVRTTVLKAYVESKKQ